MTGPRGAWAGRAISQTSLWSRSPHQKWLVRSRQPNQSGSYARW